jgi:phosphoglycolate phosphatase
MSAVPFQAVIFDLDGTLADSLRDIADAMNHSLTEHGLPTHPVDAYRTMVGEGIETLGRRVVPSGFSGDLHSVITRYRDEYERLDHVHTFPYAGVEAMLDALTTAGVRMAVLSNKRDDFTRKLVAQRFGRWAFADVRGEREGVPRKPDPTAAYELALALNVLPANIAFVGDTSVDMKTATAAGMRPIGCLWGFRGREELLGAGARDLLTTPMELLSVR